MMVRNPTCFYLYLDESAQLCGKLCEHKRWSMFVYSCIVGFASIEQQPSNFRWNVKIKPVNSTRIYQQHFSLTRVLSIQLLMTPIDLTGYIWIVIVLLALKSCLELKESMQKCVLWPSKKSKRVQQTTKMKPFVKIQSHLEKRLQVAYRRANNSINGRMTCFCSENQYDHTDC